MKKEGDKPDKDLTSSVKALCTCCKEFLEGSKPPDQCEVCTTNTRCKDLQKSLKQRISKSQNS